MSFKKIKKLTSGALGISSDIASGDAKTVMIGTGELYVSGNMGLLEYSPFDIKLSIKDKALRITGEKLMIKTIEQEEISIFGEIKSLEFL